MQLFFPFFQSPQEQLTEASREEMESAVDRLIKLSSNEYGYYLFLVLSILITTAGLLLQSLPVVIGGMIIAPLLMPLLALGLAMLLLEWRGILRATLVIVVSVLLALVLSIATTVVSILTEPVTYTISSIPVIIPPGLYFLIAFCAGVAGAFSFVKKHLSSSISGVAVSSSLVPPLCAAGVGLAHNDVFLMGRSLTIFLLNVLGIVLAAIVVFWILGFGVMRRCEQKAVEDISRSL